MTIEILALCKKKLSLKFSIGELKKIIHSNYEDIWKSLISRGNEDFYNLFVIIKEFTDLINDTPLTKIEKKVYNEMSKCEIKLSILMNLEKVFKSFFNEMIKVDLEIIGKDIWASFNMDSLYFINLNHLPLEKLSFKKKDETLYERIITINLIISSLEKIDGIYLYTKLKNYDYPTELIDNINFTKGYLVCVNPSLTKKLINLKYDRKRILRNPEIIYSKKKKMTFIESLDNSNFSHPIWINNENLKIIDYDNRKILNKKFLNQDSKIKIPLKSLNFLNSIELTYDNELLNSIIELINNNTDIHHTLTNKNSLNNIILKINSKDNIELISNDKDLKSLVSSASIMELIIKQLSYYPSFFLNHKLDSRLRIYCYAWPINYQLNHVIRVILRFKKTTKDVIELWEKFISHKFIKKYLYFEIKFEYEEIEEIKQKINSFFEYNNLIMSNERGTIIEKLKKECFFTQVCKLSTSKNDISKKFNLNYNILIQFINSNLNQEYDFWLKQLSTKQKKLPYLLNSQSGLKNILSNNYSGITWLDASSNAIQLITLRLGNYSELLLKLTNIINNDTEFSNIYEYMTEQIRNMDHREILVKVSNKISADEINMLQETDNNKYLLMPSSYGMGKISYREKLSEMISSDERFIIWEKLNEKDKIIISDYFWNCAETILSKIGFNIEEYKTICKDFIKKNNHEIFIWKNDLGIPLAPISVLKSKRHEILKKINILKLKEKEYEEEDKKSKIQNQIINLKKKLNKDDRDFWKRTMVKTFKHSIFARIYYKKKYNINAHETKTALVPNTIHAYDASIIHLMISICKKLNINILVIHDSIGCEPLLAPLLKTLFKIVNIHFIQINSRKKIFPLKYKNISQKDLDELSKKIFLSKNFFR